MLSCLMSFRLFANSRIPLASALCLMMSLSMVPPSGASAQPCQPQWSDQFSTGVAGGSAAAAVEFDDDGDPATAPLLVVGGQFKSVGKSPARFSAQLRSDGWTAMDRGLESVSVGWMQTLAVLDDGNGPALYGGGKFIDADGHRLPSVYRWDGSQWMPLEGSPRGLAVAITLFDAGQGTSPALVVAGNFANDSGPPFTTLTRYEGGQWVPMLFGTFESHTINSVVVGDLGDRPRLFVSGFAMLPGETADTARVLSWDGKSWLSLTNSISNAPSALLVATDPSTGVPALFLGGSFTQIDGQPIKALARWNGVEWSGIGLPLQSGSIHCLVAEQTEYGPGLYAGGSFGMPGDSQTSGVARWNGQSWEIAPTTIRNVSDLMWHRQKPGQAAELVAVGGFPAGLARFDHESWKFENHGLDGSVDGGYSESYAWVNDLEVFSGGDTPDNQPSLYVGGHFAIAGDQQSHSIARWDGRHWSGLGLGLGGDEYFGETPYVYALKSVTHEGLRKALYVGGYFRTAGGLHAYSIAGWDGSNWFSMNDGVQGYVTALGVFDDGTGHGSELYVGGLFTTAGGFPAGNIAKWDGEQWHALPGINGQVSVMEVFDDGHGPALYAGGAFTDAGGVAVNNIAKWDGRSWSDVNGGVTGGQYVGVFAMLACDLGQGAGQELIVGGRFELAGTTVASSIARWNGTHWTAMSGGIEGGVSDLRVLYDAASTVPVLHASGGFHKAGGTVAHNIARWNGTFWSGAGALFDDPYDCIIATEVFDGKDGAGSHVYLCGRFASAGGAPAANITKWTGCPVTELPDYDPCGYEFQPLPLACADCESPNDYPIAINDSGSIVGGYSLNHFSYRIFLWTPEDGTISIPLPADGAAGAVDINDSGAVLAGVPWPAQGDSGVTEDDYGLYRDQTWTRINPPPDSDYISAAALNDSLQVAGTVGLPGATTHHAYLWEQEQFTFIIPDGAAFSVATDLNNASTVIGNFWTAPGTQPRPFAWSNGFSHELPLPDGAIAGEALAVNEAGLIVGFVTYPSIEYYGRREAVMWQNDQVIDLRVPPGFTHSKALDLNDRGEIVGECWNGPYGGTSIIWRAGSPQLIGSMLSSDFIASVDDVAGINNNGQIAALVRPLYGPDSLASLITPVNRQPSDINGDCDTNVDDLLLVIYAWGQTDSPADVNHDGTVNVEDLLMVISAWG